jgi:hypothetical protein
MANYHVTIIKTVTTVIQVEADTAGAATKRVNSYGLQEAVSDFPVISESVSLRRHSSVYQPPRKV